MKYRSVWKNEQLIGYIAQDEFKSISIKAINEKEENYIKNIIIKPLKILVAELENEISISDYEIILTSDPNWLFYLEYSVPFNIYIGKISSISKTEFQKLKVKV